jgi:AcrR family transcriptional regulator
LSGIEQRRKRARVDPRPVYSTKREALLQAAARVFRERGFDASTINDIASESGIDRATMYYYFTDKYEIFAAVIADAVSANVATAEGIAEGPGTAVEKVEQLVSALLRSYETHYPYLFVYIQEDVAKLGTADTKSLKMLRDLGRRYHFAIENTVRAGIESGEFHPDHDPRLSTYFLLGALNWTHRWFTPGKGHSVEEIAASFSRLALNGLVAVPPTCERAAS